MTSIESSGLLLGMLLLSIAASITDCQHVSPEVSYLSTGSNLTLTCNHPSYPTAEVRWITGGPGSLSVPPLGDPRLTPSGSQLLIESFHPEELAGEYSCVVDPLTSPLSEDILVSCPAHVEHARIEAEFERHPNNTTARAGTNVVLRCGPPPSVPAPRVEWTRDGHALSLTSTDGTVMPSGNLYLLNVSVGDSGSYRCTVSNPVTGTVRSSEEAILTVLDNTDPAEVPATFTVEPTNTTALLGSTVTIECAGQGYPQPVVSPYGETTPQPLEAWSKLHAQQFPPGARVEPTGALVIEDVTLSHAGVYVCRLTDEGHQETVRREVVLTVKVPPHFVDTPPPETTIELGNAESPVSCTASSSDPLQLYLLFNSSVIQTASGLSPTVQTTPTSQLAGSHTYQCIVLNYLGCTSTSTIITFTDPTTPTSETTATPTTQLVTEEGEGSGVTPIVPTFDLMATSPHVTVHVGDHHVSMCEVTGPVGVVINITWFYNSTRDLAETPLEGVVIDTSQRPQDGKTSSSLVLESVTLEHQGTYTCRASLDPHTFTMEAHVELTVLPAPPTTTEVTPTTSEVLPTTTEAPPTTTEAPPTTTEVPPTTSEATPTEQTTAASTTTTTSPITTTETTPTVNYKPPHPPTNLQVSRHLQTLDVVVTWEEPATSERDIVGYKLNWDVSGHVTQVARASVPAGNGQHVYTISRDRAGDEGRVLVVLVWAYNLFGDGPAASVEHLAFGTTTTTTTTTTTAATPPSVLQCQAEAISPTSISLELPEMLATSTPYITARCLQAGSHYTLSPSSSPLTLEQVLPECSYTVEISEAGRTLASCSVDTPSGQLDLNAQVRRFLNGTISLTWQIPPGLQDSDTLTVEIDWGEGFVPVTPGLHSPANLDPQREHVVQLRLREGEWAGSLYVPVPLPEPGEGEEEPASRAELALLYSVIFGSVILGCCILVVVILALKYVQWSRRDSDKVTDFREKSREEFERMSLKRASISSRKQSTDV